MTTASAVRQANARDCLLVLREAGSAVTVGELAAATGLSRPTVDAVLSDLLGARPHRALPGHRRLRAHPRTVRRAQR